MKLSISAFFILAASQIVSAQQVSVFVTTPDSPRGSYRGCPAVGNCNFSCAKFSDSQTRYLSYPDESCADDRGYNYSPMYLYSKPGNPSVLDYITNRDGSVNAQCRLGQSFEAGQSYVCRGGQFTSTSKTMTMTMTMTRSTRTTSTTTTTSASPVPTCANKEKIFGSRTGRGYNGDCCKTQDDCREQCLRGKCNGPRRSTTMSTSTSTRSSSSTRSNSSTRSSNSTRFSTSTKTATSMPTQTPSSCDRKYYGKGLGDGPLGVCCSSQWDCEQDCVRGKCT